MIMLCWNKNKTFTRKGEFKPLIQREKSLLNRGILRLFHRQMANSEMRLWKCHHSHLELNIDKSYVNWLLMLFQEQSFDAILSFINNLTWSNPLYTLNSLFWNTVTLVFRKQINFKKCMTFRYSYTNSLSDDVELKYVSFLPRRYHQALHITTYSNFKQKALSARIYR